MRPLQKSARSGVDTVDYLGFNYRGDGSADKTKDDGNALQDMARDLPELAGRLDSMKDEALKQTSLCTKEP